MPETEIKFSNLRGISGSQQTAFQHLINLLARDTRAEGQSFCVKGPGADGGVECYLTNKKNEEIGWQAKFVENWGKAGPQFTQSFTRCLKSHPNLTEFVICVPFDLSDGRQAGQRKTSRQKFDDWCTARANDAKTLGRKIEFTFWGYDEISDRLLAGPAPEARIKYFFDATVLSQNSLERLFNRSKSALGKRYVEKYHQSLPIEQAIKCLCRDKTWRSKFDYQIRRLAGLLEALVKNTPSHDATLKIQEIVVSMRRLESTWNDWEKDRQSIFPHAQIQENVSELLELCSEVLYPTNAANRYWVSQNILSNLYQELMKLSRELEKPSSKLATEQAILITGDGGIGKSHLLADAVSAHLQSGAPAILALAGGLYEGNTPWNGIVQLIDDQTLDNTQIFLGALDAAAAAIGERALVCIDAINEGSGDLIWPRHLAAFLETASVYPNVAIVLSCRTSELNLLIPEWPKGKLKEIKHLGFAETGGRVAQSYIKARGFKTCPMVQPFRELDNPLLLKLVCDSLESDKISQFPSHLDSTSAVLDFALSALIKNVDRRLGLDPNLQIPLTALTSFGGLVSENYGRIEYKGANDHFEEHLSSSGKIDQSLLRSLISEGILTENLVRLRDGEKKLSGLRLNVLAIL